MEFEILENSADFKPGDLDKIMIGIAGIRSKTQPPCRRTRHTGYGAPMITWRSPKRKARPWGAGGVLRPRQLRYELSLLRDSS